MKFEDHKETTAKDCEAVAVLLTQLAADVRAGNLKSFEEFWIADGTEEGHSRIRNIHEIMVLRFYAREKELRRPAIEQAHGIRKDEA